MSRFQLLNIIKQLKENIESANITLSKEALKAIEKVQEAIPNPAP